MEAMVVWVRVSIYVTNDTPFDVTNLLATVEHVGEGVLTTDRPESSYGVPVLVLDGEDSARGVGETPAQWRIYADHPEERAWSQRPAASLLSAQGQEYLDQLAAERAAVVTAAKAAGYRVCN